jgi:hypothetical protein
LAMSLSDWLDFFYSHARKAPHLLLVTFRWHLRFG